MSVFLVSEAEFITRRVQKIYIQKQMDGTVHTSKPDFRNIVTKGWLTQNIWYFLNENRIIFVDLWVTLVTRTLHNDNRKAYNAYPWLLTYRYRIMKLRVCLSITRTGLKMYTQKRKQGSLRTSKPDFRNSTPKSNIIMFSVFLKR